MELEGNIGAEKAEAIDMSCFLWALEDVLDEIGEENRIKGRIFRLGRLE